MISTPLRHARHARVAPGPAAGAPEADSGMGGPRRPRWTRLLLAVSVTALLVAAGLAGMHVVSQPVHATADTSRQHAGRSTVSAFAVAPSCCFYSGIASAPASPSAAPRHHAAKKAAASPSASPGTAAGAVDDGGSAWPTSVAGWRLTYSTDFPGNSLPSG